MKKKKIVIGVILLLILMLEIFTIKYLNTYYHSEEVVYEYLKSTEKVSVTEIENAYFFDGEGKENAIIFYPGAKVEETAYSKLMYDLACNGIDCFLVKMPFKIAFFGMNNADNIMKSYNYDNWYLSGHSLGGVVASMYMDKTKNDIKGAIFIASYPNKKIKDNIKIISIYGEKDGVLNIEKYNESRKYWPKDTLEYVIKGGNHAGFASYGSQKGDNDLSINRDEQIKQTVDVITNNINQVNEDQNEELQTNKDMTSSIITPFGQATMDEMEAKMLQSLKNESKK